MNRLAGESSSYLKNAAGQPVDWYPWNDEAFEKARIEEKPVLLSIGAVWCHWCHVMAHESWEDPETACMVNELFVPVKVDLDERPDLDKTYQEAVGMLTGQGGWPLTVFLTPDKEPFYGGTYFPKAPIRGMPAFKEVMQAVSKAYKEQRGAIRQTAEQLKALMAKVPAKKEAIDEDMPGLVTGNIISSFDTANGGFGRSMKFPYSEILLFLMQQYGSSRDAGVWHVVDKTLRYMAAGGFYDQVGGGFHRYAVDPAWKVPHFEKMLNDNAMLLRVYLNAYRLSGAAYFKQVALETTDFVFRRMAREPAGFVSSVDADLHGEEGSYFTWTEAEIREVLGDGADAFIKAYHVEQDGNFEVPGKNVLFVPGEHDKSRFAAEKRKLLEARHGRELPFIDMAVHASWTALMAGSLAVAYDVLGDRRCLDYAKKTLDFMMDPMYRDGTLYRIYTDSPSVDGFLDDYSCTVEALIDVFRASQEPLYLDMAIRLAADCDAKFYDREHGGYFYVQEKDRTPMSMDKPIVDLSVPASNPQMALSLMKLHYYTGERGYLDRAKELLEIFTAEASMHPIGCGTYFSALDYYLQRPLEAVVVAGRDEGQNLVRLINSRVDKAVVLMDYGQERRLPAFEGKSTLDGKPTVYFCREGTCEAPMNDLKNIEAYLSRP
ncbi:conserved hypothetical protein [Methanocella paludicola SANAE]|uniref:Spermatogenesis-associated protein 20-like TRX domain-containing protein n=1 Tax=Methanocella paludicola (strain DSM 17711 / JCM 13418 / NBRC 101707 / SANAE) TaxID=304371 RepID=D1YVI3_METPS|nr:thioredoxin domain-containing protein [Methanocella paludicola]BAI60455.1 conserved hypothetical protein [Methanocella paludicola SANAE]